MDEGGVQLNSYVACNVKSADEVFSVVGDPAFYGSDKTGRSLCSTTGRFVACSKE